MCQQGHRQTCALSNHCTLSSAAAFDASQPCKLYMQGLHAPQLLHALIFHPRSSLRLTSSKFSLGGVMMGDTDGTSSSSAQYWTEGSYTST